MPMLSPQLQPFFKRLHVPRPDSHKGQNGKVMIIGGSELFHAASRWSLDIASCFVDMVFYASVPANNELMKEAKGNFWNGIVIKREDIEAYIEEADCVLIGPGMTRTSDTEQITNSLVTTYPDKKWVIDAGALQMINPNLLNSNMIMTPHPKELRMVAEKLDEQSLVQAEQLAEEPNLQLLVALSERLQAVTIVLKGQLDLVVGPALQIKIEGGNSGMSKGGMGDVLDGLIAGMESTNDVDV